MNRIFLVAALGLSSSAFAVDVTDNMAVTATITASCTISAGALDFGAYDPVAGTAVVGTATVTVACTEGTTAEVKMGQGANADAGSTDTAPLRRLSDGGTGFLSYSLFQEVGLTNVWGNDSGTSVSYTAADSSTSDLTVHGQIGASQSAPAGSYTDTVVATITF